MKASFAAPSMLASIGYVCELDYQFNRPYQQNSREADAVNIEKLVTM